MYFVCTNRMSDYVTMASNPHEKSRNTHVSLSIIETNLVLLSPNSFLMVLVLEVGGTRITLSAAHMISIQVKGM